MKNNVLAIKKNCNKVQMAAKQGSCISRNILWKTEAFLYAQFVTACADVPAFVNGNVVNCKSEKLKTLCRVGENPNEPFLLNVMVDVHTRSAPDTSGQVLPLGYAKNVYPKMLFGNPITEMEGENE